MRQKATKAILGVRRANRTGRQIGVLLRLGVLLPSANTTLEREVPSALPENITAHFARMRIRGKPPASLNRMLEDVPSCLEHLRDARVNVIGFACTAGSFYKGPSFNEELVRKIRRATGLPATTASSSVVEALRHQGAQKISVATPYTDWVNLREKEFLERSGFQVVAIKGLGINLGMGDLRPERAYQQAVRVDRAEADAVFISCTDFRTMEILDKAESRLGKPVVSSNQALIWRMLSLAGTRIKIRGHGSLLDGSSLPRQNN